MAAPREFYTHGHHAVVVGAHAQRSVEDSARFMLRYLQPDMSVLDLGCGPGSITAGLGAHVRSVVGMDTSREAIAVARRDAPGPAYQVGSVYSAPFRDGSFDVAYGHQVLQHLADPVAALHEIRRVLRPGGLVAVRDADFGTMAHHPHYAELDSWLDLYGRVARANGGEPNAGRHLVRWVRRAGFFDLIATTSSWSYTSPEERRTWARLWADRIRLPRFTERAAAIDPGVDINTIAAAWLEWAEEPDGWFAFIHGEVVARKKD